MNNKGTNFVERIKITLLLLQFIWKESNVAMIDIMLSKDKEWEHHIIASNLLTVNRDRYKEIIKSFKIVIEKIFWSEVNN
jgi:hypothetical protein